MILLTFILVCWGFTHILVKGKIFDGPRDWLIVKSQFLEGILTCHQCCGFWVGMVVYSFLNNPPDYFILPINFILYGFLSSGCVSIINAINYFLFKDK